MGPETRVCGLAARDPGGGLAARAPIGDAVRSRRLSSQESEIGESEIGESEIGGGEEWPSRGVEYKLHAQPGHLVYYSRMRSLTGVGLETLPSKTVPGSCARLTALLLLLGTWFGCDHRPHDADTVESAVADPDTTSSINGATPLVPAVATPPVGYRTWQSVPIGTGFGSEADFHIEFARSHPFLAQWKRRVVLQAPDRSYAVLSLWPDTGGGFPLDVFRVDRADTGAPCLAFRDPHDEYVVDLQRALLYESKTAACGEVIVPAEYQNDPDPGSRGGLLPDDVCSNLDSVRGGVLDENTRRLIGRLVSQNTGVRFVPQPE